MNPHEKEKEDNKEKENGQGMCRAGANGGAVRGSEADCASFIDSRPVCTTSNPRCRHNSLILSQSFESGTPLLSTKIRAASKPFPSTDEIELGNCIRIFCSSS